MVAGAVKVVKGWAAWGRVTIEWSRDNRKRKRGMKRLMFKRWVGNVWEHMTLVGIVNIDGTMRSGTRREHGNQRERGHIEKTES